MHQTFFPNIMLKYWLLLQNIPLSCLWYCVSFCW